MGISSQRPRPAWARSWPRSPDGSAELVIGVDANPVSRRLHLARARCSASTTPTETPSAIVAARTAAGVPAADRGDERAAEQRAERGTGNRQRGAGGEHAAERVRRAGPLEQRRADGGERAVDQSPDREPGQSGSDLVVTPSGAARLPIR